MGRDVTTPFSGTVYHSQELLQSTCVSSLKSLLSLTTKIWKPWTVMQNV